MATFSEVLQSAYQSKPDQVIITLQQAGFPDRPITYKDLLEGANGYAQTLAQQGIQPGEVVILILQHGVDLVFAFWGAVFHGAIPAIMPYLTEKLLPERFRVIAENMGLDSRGMSTSEVRTWLIESMTGLRSALGIRDRLAAKGIRASDIPVLSDKAVLDPCLVTNPKTANKRDIQVIYEEAT